jgi:hypothetical protein
LPKYLNQDIVIWYAAHFTRDVHQEEIAHIVGPISPTRLLVTEFKEEAMPKRGDGE